MRHLSLCSLVLVSLSLGCRTGAKPDPESEPLEVDSGGPVVVDDDGDGVPADEDCDDSDAAVAPGRDELCNGVDDDCDGVIDNGATATFYWDADGDGAGDPARPVDGCELEDGWSADSTDCNDLDPETYPGADERCDGLDNDCDTEVDEDVRSEWYSDTDDDGFGDASSTIEDCDPPVGYVGDNTDCDDLNDQVYPGAEEWCDSLDNDCDSVVDEDALDARAYYADTDGDGFGNVESTADACSPPTGYVTDFRDCDDTRADAYPGADETCNELDDDCDGVVDDAPVDATTWYVDVDSDGFGSTAFSTEACTQPSGFQADATDCDDGDSAVYPGATERCDTVDNDCDGTVDETDAVDAYTWYADADADGFGDATSTTPACTEPSGYTNDDTDCDDTDDTVFPGSNATETPGDGVDQDCDGLDMCTDLNCDGLPDLFVANHYSGSSYSASQQLFYNTGARFSTTQDDAVPGAGTWSSQVEDIDEDGYQDLVVVNYYSGSSYYLSSYVYWGSTTGYSSSDRADLQTYGAILSDIGDFDGDGNKDIAFANHYANAYSTYSYVYYGAGHGFSSVDTDYPVTYGAYGVVAEDFDQDGYDDLVFCNYYNGATTVVNSFVYYGSATGLDTSSPTALPTNGCRDVLVEDLNGDGWSDIVFANYYGASGYATNSYVYYGSASGFSTSSRDALPTVGTLGVDTGDFDGDGVTDLIFGGYFNGSTYYPASYVYYGTASGFASTSSTTLAGVGVWQPTSADLNSDGYDDIVLPMYFNGSSYAGNSYVYYGSATGIGGAYTSLDSVGTGRVSVGDLDRDGHPELVFANYYTGSWSSITGSYIYWGSTGAYTESDRTVLDTQGTWPAIQLGGNTDW